MAKRDNRDPSWARASIELWVQPHYDDDDGEPDGVELTYGSCGRAYGPDGWMLHLSAAEARRLGKALFAAAKGQS